MKKVLFITVVVLFTLSTQAQNVGIKAGLTMPNLYNKDFKTDMTIGYQVGGIITMPVGPLELEANLLLTQKGCQLDMLGSAIKVQPLYLDIPVKLNYMMELGSIGIFAGVGPTFSYGIAGKEKMGDVSEKIKWGKNPGETKPFDMSIGMQAGVQLMEKIRVGLSYDLGLVNINNVDGVKTNNRVLAIYGAYMF